MIEPDVLELRGRNVAHLAWPATASGVLWALDCTGRVVSRGDVIFYPRSAGANAVTCKRCLARMGKATS